MKEFYLLDGSVRGRGRVVGHLVVGVLQVGLLQRGNVLGGVRGVGVAVPLPRDDGSLQVGRIVLGQGGLAPRQHVKVNVRYDGNTWIRTNF